MPKPPGWKIDISLVAAAHRRRQVVAALAAVGYFNDGQGPQGTKRKGLLFSWADHVKRLTDAEFKLRYRLTPVAFYELLNLIEDLLEIENKKQARNSKAGAPHRVRRQAGCGATLSGWLNGAGLAAHLLHEQELRVQVCLVGREDAINLRMKISFPIDDHEALSKLEAEFAARFRQQVWRGQVMGQLMVYILPC